MLTGFEVRLTVMLTSICHWYDGGGKLLPSTEMA